MLIDAEAVSRFSTLSLVKYKLPVGAKLLSKVPPYLFPI
jgi:hypothetical protein